MKHRILASVVSVASAICLCFPFAACGEDAEDHEHIYTAENKCSVCGKEWEYTETDSYEFTKIVVDGVEGYDVRFGFREEYPTDDYGIIDFFNPTTVCPAFTQKEIVLPYGHNGLPVLSVGFQYSCASETVENIVVPDSVVSVGHCSAGGYQFPVGAFDGCTALKTLRLSANLSVDYTEIASLNEDGSVRTSDTVLFSKNSVFAINPQAPLYEQMQEMESVCLDGYYLGIGSNVDGVVIPDGTRVIAADALNGCRNLGMLNIPSSVVKIGAGAFANCESLTNVTIPGTVKSVGAHAFMNCNRLTSLTFADGVERIGAEIVDSCYKLETLVIPDSVIELGSLGECGITMGNIENPYENFDENGMFYIGNHLISRQGVTDTVTIREGTRTVASYAFSWSPTTVNIPGSVVTIGDSAFRASPAQVPTKETPETVTIGEGVKKIGKYAFMCCAGLKNINVPKSVTEIGSMAFYGCGTEEEHAQITYPGTIAEWKSIVRGDNPYYYNLPYLPNPPVVVHCSNGDCDRLGNPL